MLFLDCFYAEDSGRDFPMGKEGVFLFGMDVFSSTRPMGVDATNKGIAHFIFSAESLDLLVNRSVWCSSMCKPHPNVGIKGELSFASVSAWRLRRIRTLMLWCFVMDSCRGNTSTNERLEVSSENSSNKMDKQ